MAQDHVRQFMGSHAARDLGIKQRAFKHGVKVDHYQLRGAGFPDGH